MTDAEVKKALKCCVFTQPCAFDEDKFYCHHGYSKFCDKALLDDVFDLINRQEAEIKDLQEKNSNLTSDLTSLQNDLISAKAEIEMLRESRDRWRKISEDFDRFSREEERMLENDKERT